MIGTHQLVHSSRASVRLRRVAIWVADRDESERVLILSPSLEAGSRALRRAIEDRPAAFGWERLTLRDLATRLSLDGLARSGRVPSGSVVLSAVLARAIHRLREQGALGRFERVADRPGLPRALARTFLELRATGVRGARLDPDLGRVYLAYLAQLEEAGLADPSDVLSLALERARDPAPHPLLDVPVVAFDLSIDSPLHAALIGAVARRAQVSVALPSGDRTALRRLAESLDVPAEPLRPEPTADDERVAPALHLLGAQLFEAEVSAGELDESVEVFSAPGESRECVEIARRVLAAVDEGVPFDRMAVLTHAPERYRASLAEALRRAQIPAHFSRGTVRPDPAGRALLALLSCATENLSARAFAEYLSLSVVPDAQEDGAPPEAVDVPWLPSEQALLPEEESEAEPDRWPPSFDAEAPVIAGSLRAPWRWERLLSDAAVIGGADRWRRRLEGLERALGAQLDALSLDAQEREWLSRRQRDLSHLRRYALPLLDELATLPSSATWEDWSHRLARLAERAIRDPARVLAVLRELAPMGPIGPVGIAEVQLVLTDRLTEMVARPSGSGAGKLFVASTEEARGLSFERVFVPGLAERVFPRKVGEDPIALDEVRRALSPELPTTESRVERERLALRLAIGAAESRVVFSYPRLDTDRGRPRVPSFYALEVLRAVAGRLPTLRELTDRADAAAEASMAWPAPERAEDAIDGAEYDLAVLRRLLAEAETKPGAANYLVHTNPHLARSLRARFTRWNERWWPTDGMVAPSERALGRLREHSLTRRPYSATALQHFSACPYRFYLSAIVGLSAVEPVFALEELDPLSRGTLIHHAQSSVLSRLRDEHLLPVTDGRLPRALAIADEVMVEVEARFREELAPAIDRVFSDAVASVESDLKAWLHKMSERPDWVPTHFELAFGLADRSGRDPASVEEPVVLDAGISLRGAIDMVEERDGELRATDHKTGSAPDRVGLIDGGRTLQPALYALALEKLFEGRTVVGGRLDYCTTRGRFQERSVPLSTATRSSVAVLSEVVGHSIDSGFLPAAPAPSECDRCDYRPVCGPSESRRVRRKRKKLLAPLIRLRKQP